MKRMFNTRGNPDESGRDSDKGWEESDIGFAINPECQGITFDLYSDVMDMGRDTGLRLSFVQGMVISHQGCITCRSTSAGDTVFSIFFPEVQSETGEDNRIQGNKRVRGTEWILYVDDEHSLGYLAERMLGKMGYHVESMTSSVDALEYFTEDPYRFDLVVTDLSMPTMSGDKLARSLVAVRPDIPVILCSGYQENISDDALGIKGIEAYLHKPFDMRCLAKAIRRILDRDKVGSLARGGKK